MIAGETNEGFPSEMKEKKNVANQQHFAVSSASPVDVKQYNYALIYSIVALSMHEFLGIRSDFSPPTHPSVALSPSLFLFLLFHIFKCQLYLCGLPAVRSFDVFSFSVSGFCLCESGSSSVSVLLGVSFLCQSKPEIKEVRAPVPITLYLFHAQVFFTAVDPSTD